MEKKKITQKELKKVQAIYSKVSDLINEIDDRRGIKPIDDYGSDDPQSKLLNAFSILNNLYREYTQ